MGEEQTGPWFKFTIQDTDEPGVEIPKLTRLLSNLSSAFYVIARVKIGSAGPRPGRRTLVEDTLAAFRLMRVAPGSATIELAPPAAESPPRLPSFEEPTADDVVFDFYQEVESVDAGEPPSAGRWEIRRHVVAVIEEAGGIGSRAEIVYRPRAPRPGFPAVAVLRKTFRTRDLPEVAPPERSSRKRRLSGHAYMVDVEPGRQRLRVKLADGRDITMEADDELVARMGSALDRVVEIEMEEEYEGDTIARRVARAMAVLPSSGPGSDVPPKSIEELESEQHMPAKRPDYASLASAVWESEKELAEFQAHLQEIRKGSAG
jgi:hypothetical protein